MKLDPKIYLSGILKKKGFVTEYKFSEKRKFRADWAHVEKRILVEYDGLVCAKSRHTTITGFTNDCTKMNLATIEGWRVLRYTILNYTEIEKDLENYFGG